MNKKLGGVLVEIINFLTGIATYLAVYKIAEWIVGVYPSDTLPLGFFAGVIFVVLHDYRPKLGRRSTSHKIFG